MDFKKIIKKLIKVNYKQFKFIDQFHEFTTILVINYR